MVKGTQTVRWLLHFILHFIKCAHIMPLIFFNTPLKHQKTGGFLMFSGGKEKDQWHEMGLFPSMN